MPRWLERRTSSTEIRVKYHVAERMSHCQNASLNEDLKTRTFVLETNLWCPYLLKQSCSQPEVCPHLSLIFPCGLHLFFSLVSVTDNHPFFYQSFNYGTSSSFKQNFYVDFSNPESHKPEGKHLMFDHTKYLFGFMRHVLLTTQWNREPSGMQNPGQNLIWSFDPKLFNHKHSSIMRTEKHRR